MLAPGLAQVHVHVDEAGRDDPPTGVDPLRVLRSPQPLTDLGNPAVHQQYVQRPIDPLGGVDDSTTGNEHGTHSAAPVFAASAASGFPPASR